MYGIENQQMGAPMKSHGFHHDELRDKMNFIKKVYCILATQLTITAAFIYIVNSSESNKLALQ